MYRKVLFVIGMLIIALSVFMMVAPSLKEAALVNSMYSQSEPFWKKIPIFSGTPIRYYDFSSAEMTQTATPTPVLQTPTLQPTVQILTATPTPIVVDYVLGEKIDLSSEESVALVINLPDGGSLKSNWAKAVGYQGTDNLEEMFTPHNGAVYSYLGDVVTSLAHSGMTNSGQTFFATGLDLYFRKSPESQILTVEEVLAKVVAMRGSTAYLCQVGSGTVELMSPFIDEDCQGKKLELELVASVLVPHEKVEEYETASGDINEWLVESFPGSGFEKLSKDNGWIIRFCVGRLADQTSDGTPGYLYNRGVIGFRIKDGE